MSSWRLLQSAFQTWTMRPVSRSIVTTWPWYGGTSPKLDVVAVTRFPHSPRGDVIFSCAASSVIRAGHSPLPTSAPSASVSLCTKPVRGDRVDEAAGGVDHGAGGRDLAGPGEGVVARRLEPPEDVAVVRLDRVDEPVCGLDDEGVADLALDPVCADVERRGVHRPLERDLLPDQAPDVGCRQPCLLGPRIRARGRSSRTVSSHRPAWLPDRRSRRQRRATCRRRARWPQDARRAD